MLDKLRLLLYCITIGGAEMASKQKPSPQVVAEVGLDIPLQDILDGVEDSIVVVDR